MRESSKEGGSNIYAKAQINNKNENMRKERMLSNRVPQSELRKFIFKYFMLEWKMIILSQAILFFQTYLHIYQPFFQQDFIEAAIEGKTDELIELVKVFIIQNIFLLITEPLLQLFISKFKSRLEIRIQTDLFKEVLSKDVNFFEQTKFVYVQQLASGGSKQIMTLACGDRIFDQLKSLFRAIGYCYFIVHKSFYISLILLAFCVVRGIWNHFSFKWKRQLSRENFQDIMERENQFQDTIQNVITVKAFGREIKEINKYRKSLEKISHQSYVIDLENQKLMIINDILNKIQRILVLYYGSIMFLQQSEAPKVSTLTTFLTYSQSFTQLYIAIKEIFGLEELNMYLMVEAIVKLYKLKANQGLCDEIFIDVSQQENDNKESQVKETISEDDLKQLDSSQDQLQISQTQKNSSLQGDIEFDSVFFKYGNRPLDDHVLKNISFKIKGGQFVAFAGTSGGGKSTIIKLIERFYDVSEGTILIDGQNIKDINLGKLRAEIGLVQQEPILFDTTILENIVYGVDQYSDETVRQICDISGVSEFVFDGDRFPQGLNTCVGSKGLLLSGGQKQRVAIARALIKRPKILIFDEATSSLDAESEFQVQQYIDQLVKKRGLTIIVIAHRLSTIVNCDKIYVMQKGEIIEQGSHRQLLELNGYYKQLIKRQLHNNENNNENLSSEEEQSEEIKDVESTEKVKRTSGKSQQEVQLKQNIDGQNITPNKSKEYSDKKDKLNQINEQIQQQMIQKSQILKQISENLSNSQNSNTLESKQNDKELSISFPLEGLSQSQINNMLKSFQDIFQKEIQNKSDNNKKND